MSTKSNDRFKFLIQSFAKSDDKLPGSSPSFRYVVDQTEKVNEECIPFPPFTISSNFEIYVFLASIFAPLISEKNYSDVEKSLLLNWIYSFKINYPRKPNIFDFILELGFNPEEELDIQNPATFRFVIHQFCKAFGNQAQIKIKDLSMAIPKNDVLSIHVDDDILVFVPIITPIASFSIHQPESENKSKKIKFLFPTTITATVPKNDKNKGKNEQTGPAFANKNENSNDNENTNDNNNSNDNDNLNANSDENAANNSEKTDQIITFNFYGGLFESCEKPLKYILIKVGEKYYKYSCSAEPQDHTNGIEIISPDSDQEIRDYCVAAFFLKENTSLHPYIYQKI